MKKYRLQTLRGRLPATTCSQDVRERVERIAAENNISMGEVQRLAIEFFLLTAERETLTFVSDALTGKDPAR